VGRVKNLTNRKPKKDVPVVDTFELSKMEDGLLNTTAEWRAEYSHDKVTDEDIDLSTVHFEDLFDLDNNRHIQNSFAIAIGISSFFLRSTIPPSLKPHYLYPMALALQK